MKHYIPLALTMLAALTAQARTWTFGDCLDYAREHNITLQKSRLNEQTSESNLEEAKAQWQPSLDFATTHGFVNRPLGEDAGNSYSSTYGLNASWTVWNGGRRENTIRQNSLHTEADRLNTDNVLRTLETDLLQVYFNILYAREAIGIYEEAVRLSKAQAERAAQLTEAGKMSRVDYSRLNSQYEQDKYSLVDAQATYANRCMELKQLLELGIGSDITPAAVEWTAEQVLATLPPMDESYQLALDTDARLRGLDVEREAAALDVDIAKADRRPNISLNAGVGTGYNAPGAPFVNSIKRGLNESIGLTLSIPILDNKKTKMAVARAKVAELTAQLDIDKRSTELAQTVENWYIDTNSARARYSAAATQLESARLTDELTNEQFNLGYINTVELMSAHNSYIEAQHSLLQAKFMAMLGQKMIEFYRTATISIP